MGYGEFRIELKLAVLLLNDFGISKFFFDFNASYSLLQLSSGVFELKGTECNHPSDVSISLSKKRSFIVYEMKQPVVANSTFLTAEETLRKQCMGSSALFPLHSRISGFQGGDP